jgi:hypothetical protein
VKQAYKAGAVAFAEKYKPEYMGFGIEINAQRSRRARSTSPTWGEWLKP